MGSNKHLWELVPVFVDLEGVAVEDADGFRLRFHDGDLTLDFVGEPNVVGGDHGDVFAGGEPQSFVERFADALIFLVTNEIALDSVFLQPALDDRNGIVRGAVVNDDEFGVLVGLSFHAFEGLNGEASLVVAENDHGHERIANRLSGL